MHCTPFAWLLEESEQHRIKLLFRQDLQNFNESGFFFLVQGCSEWPGFTTAILYKKKEEN